MRHLLLVFIIVNVATWLRMCYSGIPRLSMGYWPELFDGPVRQLVGALLGNPLFELIYNGPGYLTGIALFLAVRHVLKLTSWLSILLLGVAVGMAIYFVFEGQRRFKMEPVEVRYLLFVYGSAGALFGLFYYRWVVSPLVAGSLPSGCDEV